MNSSIKRSNRPKNNTTKMLAVCDRLRTPELNDYYKRSEPCTYTVHYVLTINWIKSSELDVIESNTFFQSSIDSHPFNSKPNHTLMRNSDYMWSLYLQSEFVGQIIERKIVFKYIRFTYSLYWCNFHTFFLFSFPHQISLQPHDVTSTSCSSTASM